MKKLKQKKNKKKQLLKKKNIFYNAHLICGCFQQYFLYSFFIYIYVYIYIYCVCFEVPRGNDTG